MPDNKPDRTNKDRVETADLCMWLSQAPSSVERNPAARIEAATDLMIDLLHFICNETKKASRADGEAFDLDNFRDEYLVHLFDSLDTNFKEEYEQDGPYPADQ